MDFRIGMGRLDKEFHTHRYGGNTYGWNLGGVLNSLFCLTLPRMEM
jgi:hypothetical protein